LVKLSIDKKKKEIFLKELYISDTDVYEFFCSQPENADLEELMKTAIKVGILGFKKMSTSLDVDYVEKAFNQLKHEYEKTLAEMVESIAKVLEKHLSLEKSNSSLYLFKKDIKDIINIDNVNSPLYKLKEYLIKYLDEETGIFSKTLATYLDSEKGKLTKLLDSTFDLNDKNSAMSRFVEELSKSTDLREENIRKMLNSYNESSPLYIMKKDIIKYFDELKNNYIKENNAQIKELVEQLIKEGAIKEEREKGTAKGLDFEILVRDEIIRISNPYNDEVFWTGTEYGATGKKGDLYVDFDSDSSRRCVLECKNSFAYKDNPKKIIDETYDSIKNRNAKFAVFLFAKDNQMPDSYKPFKITDSYMIASYESCPLSYLYQLARAYTKKQSSQDYSAEVISKEVEVIQDCLKAIATIKKKASEISNSGDYIKKNIDVLYYNISSSVNRIEQELNNKREKE